MRWSNCIFPHNSLPCCVAQAGATVYHLTFPDRAGCYLKIVAVDTPTIAEELARESVILQWLAGWLPVPELLFAGVHDGLRYQLTRELPGVMSFVESLHANNPAVVATLGKALRSIHQRATVDCPFDQRLDRKLAQARQHVELGLVDIDDANGTRSPASVLAELEQRRPVGEDIVFTHGDYCLPNVLIDPARCALTGLIDWGRAGLADRYQDLGLAVRSLRYNLGDEWVAPFFATYGEGKPDWAKINDYILLDELF